MSSVSDSGSSLGDVESLSDREQESKKEVMSMEEGCCICDVSDASDIDPLVYCDECNLAVHKLCYGIPVIPDDDWYCNICKYWKKKRAKDPLTSIQKIKCVLCDQPNGAMKEIYMEKDKWAHIVCALFIDEVYFRDSASSTGIQIEKISQRKKVTTHRKCTYCDAQGYVVNCQCEERDCNKKFHITCAQKRHHLVMTDNSALAIEADRSTEFKVLCSKEQVHKMKERKQIESEKIKEEREKLKLNEDKKIHKNIKKEIGSSINDPEKRAKIEKLKKLQIVKSKISPSAPTVKSPSNSKASKKDKQSTPGQKRKKEDKSKKDDQRHEKKKQKLHTKVGNSEDYLGKTKDAIHRMYDEFDRTQERSIDGPIVHFNAFRDLLVQEGYNRLVEPCRKLWAYREKQKEMKAKLDSLRYTRALMERQIAIQDAFLGQLPNPIQNGDRDSPEILNPDEPISPTSTLTSHSVPLSNAASTTSSKGMNDS